MPPVNTALRKIISSKTDYCCLCFQTVEETGVYYNIQDKVIFENETHENVSFILSSILGDQILDCLSTNIICDKCMGTAMKSYKFIKMCKNNTKDLINSLNCLKKFTEHHTVQDDFKTLFVAINKKDYSTHCHYDKKKHLYQNETALIKRFKHLRKKPKWTKNIINFTIDIELEAEENCVPENNSKPKKLTRRSTKLSDIPHEKVDENNFKCKGCLKVYPSIVQLKQHYLRMHAPKDFKCSQCSRSFGSTLFLNRHIKESHCTVVCSQCGKTYTNIFSLRHHERSHKQRLTCQTCGKVYKGKQAFNHHIEQKMCAKTRKSNAEAKFVCDYCEKKYSQKTALSVHIRLEHENGRALVCDWCSKKFSSMSKLQDHVVKHTKQKNFTCGICGGKFVTKMSLLYHTRIHTGEKPYTCEHCSMRFLSASRRSEHIKRHHGSADLECDICHSKFKGQSYLNRHRKRHFNVSSKLCILSHGNKAV
ncbi:uncharacterized protein LOC142984058 [Anticarsia gemmatalis]|uniref:uncharacterized protein LOC142984058 n=1 Tax=Anticarsia gemmatalis TaxID=129554 RepID=UPI003F76D528